MASSAQWKIQENKIPSEKYLHQETVYTIGNGYMSSRGSFEEGFPQDRPTTFVNGVFNDVPLYGTELVNFPDPFALEIRISDETFRLDQGKVLAYERTLHMDNGLLTRKVQWESPKGRQCWIQFDRFMPMDKIHLACAKITLKALNFDGEVEIRFPISGVVSNLNYRHWQRLAQGALDPEGCYLFLETQETGIKAAVAQKVIPGTAHHWRKEYWDAAWMPTLVFQTHVNVGEVIDLTRYTAIHTSRDGADLLAESLRDLEAAGKVGFDILLSESEQVWDDLWSRSNIEILGDDRADRALRYNLFQVLIAAPRHDDRVSIGAKTMSGYGYRGHVFWDTEIFILPFLIYTQPKIARNLLMYRYHTLDGAREKAAFNGYQGAMYAWESASTGKDVTPVWIPLQDGSLVRVWCGDLEQHISADIAYGIHQYWQVTGDDAFMVDYGVEMILSVAQFYASRLEWDEASNKYHIHNVIGPDEYHEHVDDNAMTNLMAGWVLRTANLVAQWLMNENTEKHADLMASLNLTMEDISHWQDRQQKIWINQLKTGEIEQFRGFFDLEIVDQQSLEPRKISLQEMFGIEGVQKYQLIKQPDVVMALYLLRDHFTTEVVKKNLDYYHQRTDLTYGSSLGPSIASLMLAMYGQVEEAYGLFIHTLMTDLDNNRGNTPDGIHAASAGAVWQVVVFGFLGLQQSGNRPEIRPQLPEHWEQVRFSVVIRDETTDFSTKSPAG